jgi:hypothetical protein
MMNKIYIIFIIVLTSLAIYSTEKAMADSTTVVSPNGSITICTRVNNVVICS